MFCLNTTVCFDPYVLYLYGCLVVGGRLVIPKPEGHVGECHWNCGRRMEQHLAQLLPHPMPLAG